MTEQDTLQDLRAQIKRLTLLQEINQAFHSSIELNELLPTIFKEVIEAMEAEGGSIWLLDPAGEELECQIASGGGGEKLRGSRLKLGEGLAGWVAQHRQPTTVDDVKRDERWARDVGSAKRLEFETTSLISAPLVVKGESLGAINVVNKIGADGFTPDDLGLLTSLANNAALVIKNAQLVEEVKEAERVARDMEIASDIQKSLLPAYPPQIEGVELAGRCIPNVGGDYFDYFLMRDGKLGVLIADVSGHNVGSALVMAMTRLALRFESAHQPSVAGVLAATNRAMYADLSNAGLFITTFYTGYDPAKRVLAWANGGHNQPLLWRTREQDVVWLDADGMLVGMLDDVEYEERQMTLDSGDILLLYTDGITEARNETGEMYGEDRLCQLVRENAHLSAQELLDHIYETAREWGHNVVQYDDVTAVVMKVVV
jgi:sigma-B regulation protein RsbU (phosphoserine phosphatase)